MSNAGFLASEAALAGPVTSTKDTELMTSTRCRCPLVDDLQYAPIHYRPTKSTHACCVAKHRLQNEICS